MNPKFFLPKMVALYQRRKFCRDMVLIFVAQLLSWPAVSCRGIFSCYFLRFFRDIVLLMLFVLCRDMVVFCIHRVSPNSMDLFS